MRASHPSLLLILMLSGCASLEPEGTTSGGRDPLAQWWESAVPGEGAAPEPGGTPASRVEFEVPRATSLRSFAAGALSLSPTAAPDVARDELAIWRDPAFRRRFIESYIAETEIEPRVTIVEREHMQEVLELVSDGRDDEALGLLQKRGGPAASAVFDFTMANIYFQQERYDLAAAGYRTAVEKYPKFLRAWKNLGLIHVRDGAFEDAAEALTRVVELGGSDALTYGLLGFAYTNVENHVAAETAYRMAMMLDPTTPDWKTGLARALFEQERFADAVALTDVLIRDEPGRTDLWLLQANAFIGMSQPLRAAENYELVDELGGSTPESLNLLGDIYVNEGLYELALGAYVRGMEAAEAEDEPDPDRSIRAAKVLTARGALEETKRLVERIEESHGMHLDDERRKDLLELEARIALAEGAGDEEARVLEEIIALDPLDGEALMLLGQHASRRGDVEQAIYYYERAQSLEQYEADAKVRQAQVLVGQSRYDEALPLLRSAQTIEPRENVQEYLEQVERIAR